MSLAAWIANFRRLHERARKGQLGPGERQSYEASRDELARALVAIQQLALRPGERPREALRIARALQIDLDLTDGRQRAITLDISVGGFSVLLAKSPGASERIGFSLKLPGGGEPLTGRVRVVDAKKQVSSFRVGFAFEEIGDADRERVEIAVFDSALDQIKV